MAMRIRDGGSKADNCPVPWCLEKPIHAKITNGDFGWHLAIECPQHGWRDRGYGWTGDELNAAGLM